MKLVVEQFDNNIFIKYGSLFLVFAISIYEILNNKEKFNTFKRNFTNKHWLKHFAIMVSFVISMFLFYPKKSHEREATKKAITAFIIAIFASIDLTIAPFWIIWVLTYSFDNWV
tara:strand:+ start:756 stop:1097 length:342 start_codon:yes stop_codon:yes gene_type:complete